MAEKLMRFQRPKKAPKFCPNRHGEIEHKGKEGKIYNQKGAFG